MNKIVFVHSNESKQICCLAATRNVAGCCKITEELIVFSERENGLSYRLFDFGGLQTYIRRKTK